MTRKVETESTRVDQRFVAEATTETGVTLREVSEWKPSHWDQQSLRVEAERELRRSFKQADALNVSVGPIRITREVRVTERQTITYTKSKFYAEVAR